MKPVRGSPSADSMRAARAQPRRRSALATTVTRLRDWAVASADYTRPLSLPRKASRALSFERLEGRELLAITTVDLTSGQVSAEDLAVALAGPGVSVSNAIFTGDDRAAGLFSNAAGTGLGIPGGVILGTGMISDVSKRNASPSMSTPLGWPGDADLDVLAGKFIDEDGFESNATKDAAVLEFDLETTGQTLSFYYVFGTEEYPEWLGKGYNDVFGFFVNGVNIALVPGSGEMVSVDSINHKSNPQYFRDNTNARFNLEANGFTAILQATITLDAGLHRIKLAIADVGDSSYDSWVFLAGSTFVSGQSDLSITQSAIPNAPSVGSVLTYELTVNNTGPDDANYVIVEDVLPQGVMFVDVASTQGTVTEVNGIVTAELGTIAAGETVTIAIQVIPEEVGELTNFARVVAAEFDPALANNEATLTRTAVLPDVVIPGFDSSTLHPNDDGSSDRVSLPFEINFYGNLYDSLFVNNNGNVTFDRALSEYVPFALTSDIRTSIIAAFFADVDTRAPAQSDDDPPVPPQFANSIGTVTYGVGAFEGRTAFGVTYTDVGYFSSQWDKLNTFQLLLVDRSDLNPGDFDIVFNYEQIQWDEGEFSLDDPAVVGFSNGSGQDGTYFQLDGSLVDDAFLDSSSTGLIHDSRGSDVLGRYIFEIRGGFFERPPVPPETPTNLPETPRIPLQTPRIASETPSDSRRTAPEDFASTPTLRTPLLPSTQTIVVPVSLLGGTTQFVLDDGVQPSVVPAISPSREVNGTGMLGPDPPAFVAEGADFVFTYPNFSPLPLSPVDLDQWLIRASDDARSESLLAMIPMEHEEVALQTQLVSISGQVSLEDHVDGSSGRAEQAAFGRLIFIDDNRNGVHDPGEYYTSSDIGGVYQFTELPLDDGDYLVRVAANEKKISAAGASDPKEIRIDQRNRKLDNVDFVLTAPVAAMSDADEPVVADTSPWTVWLAAIGGVAALCGAWLLGRRWRKKRAATYAVWHTRIAAQQPTPKGPNLTARSLEDTVRDTGEPHVSKTIR